MTNKLVVEDFSLKLFQNIEVELDALDGCVVASPVSLYLLLAILAAGADGGTAEQLDHLLGNDFSKMLDPPQNSLPDDANAAEFLGALISRLSASSKVNNKIFCIEELRKPYVDLLACRFDTETEVIRDCNVDQMCAAINQWVAKKTEGRISKLIESLDPMSTYLVLVNTIMFTGTWQHPFDPSATRREEFHVTAHKRVNVDMMRGEADHRYLHDVQQKCELLVMSYDMPNLVALFVLPDKGFSISKLLEGTTAIRMREWVRKSASMRVGVSIPRLRIKVSLELTRALKRIQLTDPLSSEKANFRKASCKKIFLSQLIHSSDIEVTEKGTIASSASAATLTAVCYTPKAVDFTANRPFFFSVYDLALECSLFMAVINNPSSV